MEINSEGVSRGALVAHFKGARVREGAIKFNEEADIVGGDPADS